MQLDGCYSEPPPGSQCNTLLLQGGMSSLLKFVCCMHVRPRVKEAKMGKTTALTKKIKNETKKPFDKRRSMVNSRICWARRRRFETNYFDKTSGFHSVMLSLCNGFQSGKRILMRNSHVYFLSKILQDSLLTHRLNQGVASLIGLSGKCDKIPELFYMTGLEILKKIPHAHLLCLQYYKNMFVACHDNKQEILLNFALYLVLRQQDVTEALELLKSKASIHPFRHNVLHKAYIGLFEYLLWRLKQSKNFEDVVGHFEEEDVSDEEPQEGEFGTKRCGRRVGFSAKKAMNLFEEVFAVPGVWDVFVPAYTNLLVHHEGVTKTRKFLKKYRDKNILNPNTHRYLYHFLKSNSGSDNDLIEVLDGLIKLDPTSEYLGDLIDLKVKSGSKESVMKMIFEKLDHAGCMFDDKTWKILETYLIPKDGGEIDFELKEEVDLCWKERKSWWPEYHFRVARNLDSSEKRSVMMTKANVAEYLLGKENDFSKEIRSKIDTKPTTHEGRS